jgi:hypothetical protein
MSCRELSRRAATKGDRQEKNTKVVARAERSNMISGCCEAARDGIVIRLVAIFRILTATAVGQSL